MKYLLILPFFFMINVFLYGQESGTIKGVLIDKETDQPIPFANVFFEDTTMHGTISNDLGAFELTNVPTGISIQVSHLLYDDFAIKNMQNNSFRKLTNMPNQTSKFGVERDFIGNFLKKTLLIRR